jgi:hypothetical protein
MKQMSSYRTVLLAQTGICSGILPNALRSPSLSGFIIKCIDDVIPTVTVRTYPNQKPWIAGNIHTELKSKAAAFKEQQTTIVPVPKNTNVPCLNDYRPVALTSVAMKEFERLVMAHINTIIPETVDLLKFAYRLYRSTDDLY